MKKSKLSFFSQPNLTINKFLTKEHKITSYNASKCSQNIRFGRSHCHLQRDCQSNTLASALIRFFHQHSSSSAKAFIFKRLPYLGHLLHPTVQPLNRWNLSQVTIQARYQMESYRRICPEPVSASKKTKKHKPLVSSRHSQNIKINHIR